MPPPAYMPMNVHVKLSTTLRKYVPDYNPEKGLDVELPGAGETTAEALANRLAVPVSEIKFVMLNGRSRPLNTILTENDRGAYFPAVGGG